MTLQYDYFSFIFLPEKVLDGNARAAELLANQVHAEVSIEIEECLQQVSDTLDVADIGVWIDPIGECIIVISNEHHVLLTHWGWNKMDSISQMTFSNTFSWMKKFGFRLKFHWILFPWIQLTIFQHWFRWWPLSELMMVSLLMHICITQLHLVNLRAIYRKCIGEKCSGGRLNKKDGLTRYGNSHVKDKTS